MTTNEEILAQALEQWRILDGRITAVPRDVVAATPFDDRVSKAERRRLKKFPPSAESGHGGKELNLMLAGHKRVALIDRRELGAWASYIEDRKFVAVLDVFPDLFTIVHWEDLDILEFIIDAQYNVVTTGIALGYQPEDVLKCAEWFDAQPPIAEPVPPSDGCS